jgi:hypothetical protein
MRGQLVRERLIVDGDVGFWSLVDWLKCSRTLQHRRMITIADSSQAVCSQIELSFVCTIDSICTYAHPQRLLEN